MKVKDIVLVSDLDGTIIPVSGIISQKNKDAISKFRTLGGIFAIATGRSPAAASEMLKTLGVDNVMIANNGALIYDVKEQKSLWSKYLDDDYKDIVKYVVDTFPQVGIELITDDGEYYIASENDIVKGFIRGTNFSYHFVEESAYPNNCCKVLFVARRPFFYEFINHMREKNYENFDFVESGGDCFEMMSIGISKGYPFERLINIYDKNLSNSAAIGDYYNDVEMIEKAAIGAAVGNAIPQLKAIANVVVKNCEDDGLADFIEYLIDHSNEE